MHDLRSLANTFGSPVNPVSSPKYDTTIDSSRLFSTSTPPPKLKGVFTKLRLQIVPTSTNIAMREQSRLYAERVLRQSSRTSSDPLYCGEHLRDVAEYLNRPPSYRPRSKQYELTSARPFAHLLRFDNNITKAESYSSATTFEDECEGRQQQAWHSAGLLFLTGHGTPEWLNAVGGEFDISPLHLLEHLSFRPTIRSSTFAYPTLPSASTSTLTITIPTLGNVECPRSRFSSSGMQDIRGRCDSALYQDCRELDTATSSAAGSPVVRRFYLHNSNTFTLEQDITISLVEKGNRWTLVLMCDSAGDGSAPEISLRNLTEYAKAQFHLVPIIQMNRTRHAHDDGRSAASGNWSTQHSLALLPSHYGQMLNGQLATQDPFYALSELFDFFVSAELQFVNMMHFHVNEEVDLAGQDGVNANAPSLTDFQYMSAILDSHVRRVKRLLATIRNRGTLDWPQPEEPDLLEDSNDAATRLMADMEYLIERLGQIVSRTERGKDVVLGNANLLIAQRSFLHNIELGRLTTIGTLVAILYVPLSFVTTVFGINVVEFGQGTLSIWVWAVASAVVLSLSLLTFVGWRQEWLLGRIRH
ncbi:hypothetical protein LTR09_000265 [Extremus antarcticus]|uniref:Uncharacterized protein n=1 Tax=Extremus antarcticus TaxID=702011 RepID=A0AAJ0GJB2_9PEZI|nr:hypothetical protein LTR09_000265 [Extremus antarcticus]